MREVQYNESETIWYLVNDTWQHIEPTILLIINRL
jgi:hypothetical protein